MTNQKKSLFSLLLCIMVAIISFTFLTILNLKAIAVAEEWVTSENLAQKWNSTSNFNGSTTTEVTYGGGAKAGKDGGNSPYYDLSAPGSFVGNTTPQADLRVNEQISYYFNLKEAATDVATEMGFALVNDISIANPYYGAGAGAVELTNSGVKLFENGALSTTGAVSSGVNLKAADIFHITNWEGQSNIQIKVTFIPSISSFMIQTLKTGVDSGFVTRIAGTGLTMPSKNTHIIIYTKSSTSFLVVNWALPEITYSQVEPTIFDGLSDYTGFLMGADGAIINSQPQSLGAKGKIVMEFDVTENATTADSIAFGLGRSPNKGGNSFAEAADSFGFYYGATECGGIMREPNNAVYGDWDSTTSTNYYTKIFLNGHHFKVSFSVGEGIYNLLVTKAQETIANFTLSGLNFSSTDNVYMGLLLNGQSTMTVDHLRIYTVKKAPAFETVDLIAAIGEVAYTPGCKAKIDAARTSYNALTAEQKALVSNLATLTTAETTYQTLKDKADANIAAAAAVDVKIDAIGVVAYTPECKAKIDAARTSYNALTAEQQALVTSLATLTTAESSYAQLKAAADKVAADTAAANLVIEKITAIGTVTFTDECKAKITTAKTAYDNLTPDQKALVTNLQVLTQAELDYLALKDAASKCSITYKLNGGVNSSANLESYSMNTSVTLENPIKTGSIFVGWVVDNVLIKPSSAFTINSNKTVEAIFINMSTVGAGVRLSEPTGLRFTNEISTSDYNALKGLVGENKISLGTLLMPTTILGANELTISSANVLNITKTIWAKELAETKQFNAVLLNIPETKYKTEITARAYITITYSDGTQATYYSASISRSISSVAKLAYDSGVYTEAENALLLKYIGGTK